MKDLPTLFLYLTNIIFALLSLPQKHSFELIIADDGSVDQPSAIVHELQKQYPSLRLVNNEKNQGRGSALTRAFTIAKGDLLLYIDADLSIDYHLFDALEDALSCGYDVATCSKHLPASKVEYPKMRRIASKCYSSLVRSLFSLYIHDYQCGFKAFQRKVIENVLPLVESKGWSWDTEILIRSHLAGYKIKEIPATVVNIYERESTVHLIKDSWIMGNYIFKLFWKLKFRGSK